MRFGVLNATHGLRLANGNARRFGVEMSSLKAIHRTGKLHWRIKQKRLFNTLLFTPNVAHSVTLRALWYFVDFATVVRRISNLHALSTLSISPAIITSVYLQSCT